MSEKLAKLVRALDEGTTQGLVKWQQVDDNCFRTTINSSLVRISRFNRQLDAPDDGLRSVQGYDLVLTNPFAQVVEDEEFLESDERFGRVEALFKSARRSATNGDAIVNQLLSYLGAS